MKTALLAENLEILKKSKGGDFELIIPELAIYRDEVLVILGPNGSGKSTLLRTLAGVDIPYAGTLKQKTNGRVTMVFQRPIAFAGSVLHNARIALRAQGLSKQVVEKRSQDALTHFGIAHLSERPASELSGGELRRLALARAFALEPAVLLLDEPFDDLDARAQEALSTDLRNAVAQTGTAVVVVTHDLQRAALVSDRIAVLLQGRMRQIGTQSEVLNQPVDRETAELVGMSNLIQAELDSQGLAHFGSGQAIQTKSVNSPGPVYIGLRPEHLKLELSLQGQTILNEVRVTALASDGLLTTLHLDWGGETLRTHLVAGRGLARQIDIGTPLSLSVLPEDVHILSRN
ncbi:MAG: hypothetical protein CL917_09545 [Deltaproteobacteria bacterium]|nr:hypothetical protein [Deltaproteobacteria bacterium]